MDKQSSLTALWLFCAILIGMMPANGLAAVTTASLRPTLPESQPSTPVRPNITSDNANSGDQQKPGQNEPHDSIVAGFTLEGNKHWERVKIQDMIVIVSASGQRYLPLNRLLKALNLERIDYGERIEFKPDGLPQVVINRNTKELIINGNTKRVDLIEEVSEITNEQEMFLPPEVISELFGFDVNWDEQSYTFSAQTTRKLGIWKIAKRPSLFAIQVTESSAGLPELFPTAYPGSISLDFLELRLRATLTAYRKDKMAILDTLQETLWGSFLRGTYKLQFSQPQIDLYNKRPSTTDSSAVMLNRGEWKYRNDTAEISVGDSIFGLNDLTFPAVRMTGVRFNGLSGLTPEERALDRSSLGLRNNFMQRRVFQGVAPLGSQVELIINDRVLDTQEALTDGQVPTGVGTYRFEDIYLPPGNLNEVRIVITELDGRKSYLQWNLLGSSSLVPAKRLAYLGGFGISRDVKTWNSRGIFAGIRSLYGATEHFTFGGTVAYQQNFYPQLSSLDMEFNKRQIPISSIHMGGQLTWNPFSFLLLTGDMSFSQGKEKSGRHTFSDTAFKISADMFPNRDLTFHTQIFRYGPDFFDGQNIKLYDRQGYAINGRWRLGQNWDLDASFGQLQNNLNGEQDETLDVNFQSLELVSRALPNSTLTMGVDRLAEGGDRDDKLLYTVKLVSHPFKDLTFDGSVSTGNSLTIEQNLDFTSGLRLPGISAFKYPSGYAVLRKSVFTNQEIGLSYWQSGNRERGTVLHSIRAGKGIPVQSRTEFGYDMTSESLYFDNRTQCSFDTRKSKNIELQTRLEENNWTVSLYFNFLDLFSFSGVKPRWISNSSVQPDIGGVQGKVFMDYNANGSMEPDEPGVENIKVVLDGASGVSTDEYGYYILPGSSQSKNARVFYDQKTVPAIYTATHGIQTAHLVPGTLTNINLGITPVIAVTGFVYSGEAGKSGKPLAGVRICLKNGKDLKQISDSITAADGSFYIGDVKPGKYIVEVDHKTLPKDYSIVERERVVEIPPSKEPQDFKVDTFHVIKLGSGRS